MLSRPDGFKLFVKLWVKYFFFFELLCPNNKFRPQLIRARPIFCMISDKPNLSLGFVDCSLYTRRIALKDDYHKKILDMFAYIPVEFYYMETLAKTSFLPARQNPFNQETFSTMLQFVELPMQ